MNKTKLRFAPFVAALLAGTCTMVVSTRDAFAVGTATGRVIGTVIEQQTQSPVPGAVVTLSGGTGVHQKTQTQEDGTYEFATVPPGKYDLTLTYEGLKPIKRVVNVRADQAAPVNIVWSAESANEETMVVQEERHLTNPDSPQTGQTYSMDRTNELPMARQYQSVANQIPGVTSGGGNPSVKGAGSADNRYLVNGLDTTDPVSNTFSANYQQDALESVSVTTGGFEAKYNALGSIIAVQTRRGTNEFHGAASVYWTPRALVDYKTFGAQTFEGDKPWNYSAKKPEQGAIEANVSAQGPIIKDHLFFNVGLQYGRSTSVQPAGAPRFVQAPSRVFTSIYPLGGLTFVPVDAHRFHVEFFGDPTTIDYADNSSASANSSTPYSQRFQNQGGYRATAEWSWLASKHVSTKVLVGYQQTRIEGGSQGVQGIDSKDLINGVPYNFQRAQHINADDSTSWFNNAAYFETFRRRMQIEGSITATFDAAGHHEAEYGVQTSIVQQNEIDSQTGGSSKKGDNTGFGIGYTDRGGGPLDSGLCDMDPGLNPAVSSGTYTGAGCFQRTISRSQASYQSGNTFGSYIQDRYKPVKWLTLLPGVRWDIGTMRASNSTVSQSASGWGPRMSVLADLTGDGKTVLQASYGRTTQLPTLAGVLTYDQARRNFAVVEQYNANSRRFEFLQTQGGADGTRINTNSHAATNDELLLSARREVTDGVLARIDYTYRYLRRQYESPEINGIMDPTGTRLVGFVNGIPTRIYDAGFTASSVSQYSGVDLILEAKAKDFEVQGGYTLSQSWGNAGSGAFDNPRFADFYQSYQSGVDTRHAIKTSTNYHLLGGFVIGLVVNWRSGVAQSKSYSSSDGASTIRRAPAGYDPGAYYNTGTSNPGQLGTYSDIRSWTSFRSPDLFTANLMLTYDFEKILKQHLIANASVSNVLALYPAGAIASAEGAPGTTQFGLASGRQSLRSVQLGLRYEF